MRMDNWILGLIFLSVVGGILIFSRCSKPEGTEVHFNYTPVEKRDATPQEKRFVELVNNHRDSLDLPLLIHEVLSSEVCRDRNINDINANIGPDHNGWYEMVLASKAKEGDHIFAEYYMNADELFKGYLNSEGHRSAIEKYDRTHIGTSYINMRNHTLIVKY
jgi:uncharacterized protein YkwD